MWGLPAAALAIWHTARPENRAKVGGIMVSAALTSFLTGITEPIEFSFLFVAPLLYGLHALLAGAQAHFIASAGDPPRHHVLARPHRLLVLFPTLAQDCGSWSRPALGRCCTTRCSGR